MGDQNLRSIDARVEPLAQTSCQGTYIDPDRDWAPFHRITRSDAPLKRKYATQGEERYS
jgi:hypothetical protein